MQPRVSVVLIALSTMLAGSIEAQTIFDDRFYVAPTAGYTITDHRRAADDHWGVGLAFGKPVGHFVNVELGLRYEPEFKSPGEFELWTATLDGLFFFGRRTSFAPFVIAGVGAMHTDVGVSDGTGFMFNGGLGFLAEMSDHVALRADARYRWDDDAAEVSGKSGFHDAVLNVGLHISFGPKPVAAMAPPPPPPVVAPPPPADSDGDGVTDDRDKCPGTPRGAIVDANGCELDADGDGVVDRLDRCPGTPAGAKVDANGCELDSDGDGVVDRLDRCPGTPAGAKVDANGCELDSDGDGVVDRLDQCPDTPKGDKVDTRGCTLKPVIVLKGVNFDSDKATLRPESSAILDDSVVTLKRYPELKVEVAGHTDSTNTNAHNLDLSRRRAKTVREYFISHGIDASRLTAKGYGEEEPIASNDTAEGKFENRRVELRITDK